MECSRTWVTERTQRPFCHSGCTKKNIFFPEQAFATGPAFFWNRTHLLRGRGLLLPHVEDDLEQIFEVDHQRLCLHGETSELKHVQRNQDWGKRGSGLRARVWVTCCAVLMAKNWCCPSAPHTYPNARLSVTSLAMKEILFTGCSCSITWRIETFEFSGGVVSAYQRVVKNAAQLTPDRSSTILMPDMEMLTQILCLCLPWERAATAIPWGNKANMFSWFCLKSKQRGGG